MATLRVNSGLVRHVYEQTYCGEIIGPDTSTTINVSTTNELELPEGLLSFHVVVKVPRQRIRASREADALAIGWLKATLPDQLAAATYWDFFGSTWLAPNELLTEPDPNEHGRLETQIDLTPPLLTRAGEAIAHLADVQRSFAACRERLWQLATGNMPLGFKNSHGEAMALFCSIAEVLDAGADVGADIGPTEVRSAMSDYGELGKRVNVNHPGYESRRQVLQRTIYCINFPSTWGRRPPTPALMPNRAD